MNLPQAKLVLNGTLKPTAQQWATPRPAKWAGKKVILSVGSYIPRKARPELRPRVRRGKRRRCDPRPARPRRAAAGSDASSSSRRGVRERIEIVGGKTPQEVQQYMVWADLFALPSWWEAFGLVYLEAMAGAHADHPEQRQRHGGGDRAWRARLDRPAAEITPPSSSALRHALTQVDLESMGQRGQAIVDERFSWEKNGETILHARRTGTVIAPDRSAPRSV